MHTVCRYDVWVQWPCDPMNIVMVLGSIDSQWQCEHGTYVRDLIHYLYVIIAPLIVKYCVTHSDYVRM